ncbi:MAG: DsrE family protein [Betaproteobacteria bacterium]|nr:DsrE family protein [Betaproteobacteria bacterium]
MARTLIILSHGSEDPTRAGVAFLLAKGAVEAGHKPEMLLAGDATVLARKVVADNVLPVGIPPLKELIQFAIDNRVPVHT